MYILEQGVPLTTEPSISLITGWLADRCSMSQQLGALQTHTIDTFLFISHTTNVELVRNLVAHGDAWEGK